MQNSELAAEVKRGLPEPVYFIWSTESLFLEDAVSAFKEAVIRDAPADFNFDVFYPSASPQEVLNAAETLPFMAPRRLVVLRDYHQFPAAAVKALSAYMKEPSETTCLLVLSQKAPSASADFRGKTICLNITERELPDWVKRTAAARGVKMTNEALDTLIEYVGPDVGLLMMEVEKLSSIGSRVVTEDDIVSSATMMREFTAFELVDSLVAGDRSRSFKILKTMLSTMSGYELPLVMGTLNWHYKQFYTLWLSRGKRPLKMRERTYRMLMKHLPGFSEEDFFRTFRFLHEADLAMKTSGRPELVLEALLIRLLQKRSAN